MMKVVQVPPSPKDELSVRLARIEYLLEKIREGMAPSLAVRFGRAAVTAFASVFGAAVLLALAIAVLQPFTHLTGIGDRIERILDRLEQPEGRQK